MISVELRLSNSRWGHLRTQQKFWREALEAAGVRPTDVKSVQKMTLGAIGAKNT